MVSNTQNTQDSKQIQDLEQQIEGMLGPEPESIEAPKPPKMPSLSQVTDVPKDIDKDKKTNPQKPQGKLKRLFHFWWDKPRNRYIGIGAVLFIIFSLLAIPNSRYFILNNVGVRSSASLTVLDNSTGQPLKNVKVSLEGQSGLTDSDGNVKLSHLKLGRTQLLIEKRAFASQTKTITLGWGSNPLGQYPINPAGVQYSFTVTDWLSGKPIAAAEASTADSDANADGKGYILLTLDKATVQQDDTIQVTIHADTYRDEVVTLNLDTKTTTPVTMVPARKHVFISNRSGKYDLYSVDVDGENENLVLAGTGLERDNVVVLPSPTENVVALVSSRVNVRDSQGYLLNTLTVINLDTNSTYSVAQSEQIQPMGWIGNRLIYVQIIAGASASDPGRFKLLSYDYTTGNTIKLASANSFNDVLMAGDSIYYSPSSTFHDSSKIGLIKSSADGSNVSTLLDKEVWNIFRVSYDTLNLSVQNDWYTYTLGGSSPTKLLESPANPKNRLYINSADNLHSVWVDQRDGKGVLIDHDIVSGQDTILKTQSGLNYPVRWLTNNILVYRIHTDQETADYAISIDGGDAHKITDVYNYSGQGLWYFY